MASPTAKYISKLHESRVLVLGGTSGIGFCVAEAALEQGAQVWIASSTQHKLDHAVSRLQSSYPDKSAKVSGCLCDLSDAQQLESNLESLFKAASVDGKIDHIVYTAGDPIKPIPLAEATPEAIYQTGTVRFLGPLMLAKVAQKYLSPGPKSSITLTSGVRVYRPAKDWTAMVAYGSGLEGMTRGLAVELAPIRVNLVCPGAVKTEAFDRFPKEVIQSFKDASLLERLGTPEDLAEAYIYTMKDHFVTGEVIKSEGGLLLK